LNNTAPSDRSTKRAEEPGLSWANIARSSLKQFLPESVLREVRRYRSCEGVKLPLYLYSRISLALGLPSRKSMRGIKPRSVLFVCFGNIMRSPMCEHLMDRALGSTALRIRVTSAGLNAVAGREAHPWAIAAARNFDISLENHRARLLTPAMVSNADLIFAMDLQNYAQLIARFPQARKQIYMLGAFKGPDADGMEIRDPYDDGPEATFQCYRILLTCIHNLSQDLIANSR
jgi:protein-tyrosine phosphatase